MRDAPCHSGKRGSEKRQLLSVGEKRRGGRGKGAFFISSGEGGEKRRGEKGRGDSSIF